MLELENNGPGTHKLKFVPCPTQKKHLQATSVTFLDRDIESRYKTSLSLQGWAIPWGGTPKTVLVTSKGMTVGAAKFEYERHDALKNLAVSELSYKPGFHLRINTICLPENLALEVWVDLALDDGSFQRVRLGEVQGLREPLPGGIKSSRYSPILVPALGRSGTTLMMTLLNAHPEVVAPGGYPHEYRQASYLWHAMRVITSPANFELSMHPDSFEVNHFYNLGYNPYLHRMYHKAHALESVAQWQDEVFPVETVNFFKEMLDQYLDRVVADTQRSEVRFLAEKAVVSPMNDLVMNIYPNAKQIFLVRDLRDSFLSARAFNEKRGTKSFGFEGRTDQQVLASRTYIANMMVQAQRHADERTLFVRYEDLIQDQRKTLVQLLEFLGLDSSSPVIDAMIEALQANGKQRAVHATTRDAASSVERWRNELSEAEQEYCLHAYKRFFETFGYPVA